MSDTGDKITRIYGNFRGVDFRGDEINLVRSPDSLNMWKDYRKTDSVSTRPSMELLYKFDKKINGIFFYQTKDVGYMMVHSGTKLYRIWDGKLDLFYDGLDDCPSIGFMYEDYYYIKDKTHYLTINGINVSNNPQGTIPTTSISRSPSGGGKQHQDVNMMSDYRINTFCADGTNKEYYLDTKPIDSDYTPSITLLDKPSSGVGSFVVDYAEGKITFAVAPEAPLTDGQDNVEIKFKKHVEGYRDRIMKCELVQQFDNRVFFSGNPDYPNVVYHCQLNDPLYWSDTDYYNEGLDNAKITGLATGSNNLWVFREPSEANTSVFYHTPVTDAEYGKIYPSQHSNIATGCVGKAVNFNDDIVFFSERGMEGFSGDITTEQAIAHRSVLVDSKLTAEKNYKNMRLEEWEGYLVTIIDNKAYLADSRGIFTNENHYEYEWFYWELEKNITSSKVKDGVLYLGTEDGLYTLTGDADIESWWTTPKDKFGSPNKLKTTNKRGCVVEATGDITVYAKTEKTDFELIGTHENITDFFVSRIKKKKWKDIQLKFYSPKRFSIETATLEAYIGGYIKR